MTKRRWPVESSGRKLAANPLGTRFRVEDGVLRPRVQRTSASAHRSSPRRWLTSSASARAVRRQRKRPPRETPQGRPFCRFPSPLPVMPFVGGEKTLSPLSPIPQLVGCARLEVDLLRRVRFSGSRERSVRSERRALCPTSRAEPTRRRIDLPCLGTAPSLAPESGPSRPGSSSSAR
jgi:hypothetical protein